MKANISRLTPFLISIFTISILITACKKNPTSPTEDKRRLFEAANSISVHVDGVMVYEFDLTKHQVVYTTDQKLYIITNMEQTEYYSLSMPSTPALNTTVDVTHNTSGISSLKPTTYTMTVLKVEEDTKFWLWDDKAVVGFVLDFL